MSYVGRFRAAIIIALMAAVMTAAAGLLAEYGDEAIRAVSLGVLLFVVLLCAAVAGVSLAWLWLRE